MLATKESSEETIFLGRQETSMATPSAAASPEKQKLYEQIVDTLIAIFHTPHGYRPIHAKGIVCEGVFTPTPQAAALSRAAHFSAPTSVYIRLSDFTGVPNIPDTDPNANPRGLALKFQLPDGKQTDIVAHSVNGFPVGTAEEFLEFLQALAASAPDAPHPNAIEKFVSARPAALAFVTATPLPPVSFANESFYAVNAVRFANKDGAARYVRYQVRPVQGEKHVAKEDLAKLPADFLFMELKERLARSPIEWKFLGQLAQEGDPIDDGSKTWPEDREQVELGTIRAEKPLADSDAAQRRLIFDPVNLTDGIELSDDPLPPARSAVYSISYARRNG
jgi:catalase